VSWGNLREKYSASLTTAETIVANIDVTHVERLAVEVDVSGSPLATFVVNARFHPAGTFNELYSSSGDYSGPTGLLIATSSDLTSLAGTGWLILDTRALDVVQIQCSSQSASTIAMFVGG